MIIRNLLGERVHVLGRDDETFFDYARVIVDNKPRIMGDITRAGTMNILCCDNQDLKEYVLTHFTYYTIRLTKGHTNVSAHRILYKVVNVE